MPVLNSVNDLVVANERVLEALKFQKRTAQPLSQTVWEIKNLYLQSRYQECISKARRELVYLDDDTHPLHRAALSFYAGLASDSWSRNMPTNSSKLFPMIKQATNLYQEAIKALTQRDLWKQEQTLPQLPDLVHEALIIPSTTPCRSLLKLSRLPVLSPTKSTFSTAHSPTKHLRPESPDESFDEDPFELENLDIISPLPTIPFNSPTRSPTKIRYQVRTRPTKTPEKQYQNGISTPSSVYSTPGGGSVPPPPPTPIFQPTLERSSLPSILLADRQPEVHDARLEHEMEEFKRMIEQHIRSMRRFREKVRGRMESALFAAAMKSNDEDRGRPTKRNQPVSNGKGTNTSNKSKASDTKSSQESLAPGGAVWI